MVSVGTLRAPSPVLDSDELDAAAPAKTSKAAPVVTAPVGLDGLRAAVKASGAADSAAEAETEMEKKIRELSQPTAEMRESEEQMADIDDRLHRKSQELKFLENKMREAGDFDHASPGRGDDEDEGDGESKGRRGRMGLEWQREIAIRSRNEAWNARQARLIAQKRLQFDVAKLQEERRLAEARSQRLAKMDMQRVEQYKLRVKTDLLNKDRERFIRRAEEERRERQMAHDARVQQDADLAKDELFKRIEACRKAHMEKQHDRLHSKKVLNEFMNVAIAARADKDKKAQQKATAHELEKLAAWKKSRDVEKEKAGPAKCVIERLAVEKDELETRREEKIRQREAARNARAVDRHKNLNARPVVGLGRQLNGPTERAIVRGDISLYYLSSIIPGEEESSEEEHIL